MSEPKLRVFCRGPGIGEAIVVQLPCGGWGTIDCYDRASGPGTLEFLRSKEVGCLRFLCLTHPHEDHYLGMSRLVRSFTGKIERVWRFPGFTSIDLCNLALTAMVRARFKGDPEAKDLLDDYLLLLQALSKVKKNLSEEHYRQIIAPVTLIEEDSYKVVAINPTTSSLEDFQKRFARIVVKDGPMLLAEEGGEMINSVSIALRISFGAANVYLLGDSQGSAIALDKSTTDYSLVKIAHHGSHNGLAADVITSELGSAAKVDHGVVTSYIRSRLPTDNMVSLYRQSCRTLVQTNARPSEAPKKTVHGLMNARVSDNNGEWVGFEISGDGNVLQI